MMPRLEIVEFRGRKNPESHEVSGSKDETAGRKFSSCLLSQFVSAEQSWWSSKSWRIEFVQGWTCGCNWRRFTQGPPASVIEQCVLKGR